MSRPSYPYHGRPTPKVITDPRMDKRNPQKWYNPMYKMRAAHRARKLNITIGETGALELHEQEDRRWNHPVSIALQNRFLLEVEAHRRLWHSADQGDVFAGGAVAAVHFEGDSRVTLRLHSIPGVMNRKDGRKCFIGVVERVSNGLTGPQRSIARLGGEGGPVLQRANG